MLWNVWWTMWGTVADTGEAETMRWVDVDDFDRVCLCVCVCVCLERAGALQSPAASLTPLGFPTPYLLTKDGTHVGLGHVVAAGASKKKEAKPGSDVRSFGCQVKFSRTKKKKQLHCLTDRFAPIPFLFVSFGFSLRCRCCCCRVRLRCRLLFLSPFFSKPRPLVVVVVPFDSLSAHFLVRPRLIGPPTNQPTNQ